MTDNPRNGGRILVEGLIKYDVKHAFCVPGESYLAALDAFYDHQQEIQMVVCRQEGGAAYMTEAYGKLVGEPGVCFVSRGPGASNAMIGVHTAYQDSTPLLLFIGQIPREERGREAFQELDYQQVYGGVAKAVYRIEDAADIPGQLYEAWTTAISSRPGPVVIELPEDMLRDEATVSDREKPVRTARQPTAQSIRRFAELLSMSQRPLLICGGAAWTPADNKALETFSEKHQIPVTCAFRRQDMFDNTHPNYIGEFGIKPDPELVDLLKQSDLVIALGPRLGEMTTSGYTLFDIPEFDKRGKSKLVHIFPSSTELNSVFHAELAIDSDASSFLESVNAIDASHADRFDRIETAKKTYQAYMDLPRNTDAAVRMDQIMEFLRQRLPADSIVTNGAGNYTLWAQRNYQFRLPNTQLACTNGSMGYGVPSAIAGKIVRPQSMVVSFSGDGCFMMNGQELATAVQYGLNIIFLIVNNNRYGTILAHQEKNYPGRPVATALNNPDFAELARAYGAFGATVRTTAEFEPIFEQAVSADCPAVIELVTDY